MANTEWLGDGNRARVYLVHEVSASDLFAEIERVVPALEGWCTVPKATALAATVLALRPTVTLEIGVFGGRSLIPLALAHRYMNQGVVFGIDPWNASSSTEEMDGANKDYWGKLDHDAIYNRFVGWVDRLSLNNHVRILRTRSDSYDWPADLPIDVLHIDGGHGVNAATGDARRYGQCVRPGGICFVDDICWDSHGPEQAIEILKSLGFAELYRAVNADENWAVFQRV